MRTRAAAAVVLLTLAVLCSPVFAAKSSAPPIALTVDATEAARKLFHARLVIPANPGPLTLFYPKWIPGEHEPSGPIADLGGLKITAAGRAVPWHRDPVDMYAFHLDVPPGAGSIEVALDYLAPAVDHGFSSGASATAELAVISWNQLLLYPQGWTAAELTYAAKLRLPAGWKFGTALPAATQAGDTIEFQPVPLETLVDSPVIAGAHVRVLSLAPDQTPAHRIDLAADSAAALEVSPELAASFSQLVRETGALFGARHYRRYDFLLSLSDHVAHFGLEHHESSDNRLRERAFLDGLFSASGATLLSHEFAHSWNGKYRRPAGLATPDYQQPMQGELLWVYEGLTDYLGGILAARSGIWAPDQYRQHLAMVAASLDNRPGRTWRPLLDTTVAAQILYSAREDWVAWRRSTDFYPEGTLLWLELDTILRQQSKGQRSLDDFCRRFFGGQSGPPMVKTYTFDDIVAALNDVAPYDWRGLLTTRLNSTAPHAPLGGVEGGGWKLVYSETPSELWRGAEQVGRTTDLSFSLGISLKNEDGAIMGVIPGFPAGEAGIGPGMKLRAVNGRRWTPDILHDALRAAKSSSQPIEMLVQNGEFFKTYSVNYHGGDKYPHLERDPGKPDLLNDILKPLAPRPLPGAKPAS